MLRDRRVESNEGRVAAPGWEPVRGSACGGCAMGDGGWRMAGAVSIVDSPNFRTQTIAVSFP
jgi:hypothetical protein